MSDDRGIKFGESATPGDPGTGKHAFFMPVLNYALLAEFDHGGTTWYYSKIFGMWLSADYTLAVNNGTAEKCFGGSTNGAITLPANSAYQFDWQVLLTNTGISSHTWGLLFGGTAATLTGSGRGSGRTATSNALTAPSDIYSTTPGSVLVLTATSTSATENVILTYTGTLRIGNTAGTLIPQIKPSAATGGTAKVLANSFFRLTPIGSDVVQTLGAWS